MNEELRLSPDFALPLAAMTRRIVVLGQSDTGKTNTVTDLVEEVLERNLQTVIVDYKGDFWGLQSSADGKRKGYPIVIFGGDHGDIDLHEDAGAAVANVIVTEGFSAILDLSNFEIRAAMKRFVTAFSKRLFFLKKDKPTPLLVVLDEVDQYAPQRPFEGEQTMLGAIETLVRLGRKRGIGIAMTTQAPAIVSKNVLEQGDLYVFHQIAGKNAVKAVEEAIRRNATAEELQVISRGIGRLQKGEAFVYSPAWLRTLQPVKMRRRRTFDSSRTPEVGDVVLVPTARATPDIAALRANIAASIERVKADDPKALKARIRELEKIVEHPARPQAYEADTFEIIKEKIVEVPVLTADVAGQLRILVDGLAGYMVGLHNVANKMTDALNRMTIAPRPVRESPVQVRTPRPAAPQRSAPARQPSGTSAEIGKGERATLIAVAQHNGGVTRTQASILTGYKRSSRDAYIQRLRTAGYVDVAGDRIVATGAGVAALGHDYEPLPTGRELQRYWLDRLPEGESKVLSVLLDVYPQPVPRTELDDVTGYKRSSRDAYLQRLKARELIRVVAGGAVAAADTLFA